MFLHAPYESYQYTICRRSGLRSQSGNHEVAGANSDSGPKNGSFSGQFFTKIINLINFTEIYRKRERAYNHRNSSKETSRDH